MSNYNIEVIFRFGYRTNGKVDYYNKTVFRLFGLYGIAYGFKKRRNLKLKTSKLPRQLPTIERGVKAASCKTSSNKKKKKKKKKEEGERDEIELSGRPAKPCLLLGGDAWLPLAFPQCRK